MNFTNNIIKTIFAAIITVVVIFFLPWISFWLYYFGGWVAKLVIGKFLVEGFEIIGIYIPYDKIPLIAGTIGWISGFFKQVNFNKK